MAFLKGIRTGGYVEINENVRFMNRFVSKYVNPWSVVRFVDGDDGVDTNNGLLPTKAKLTIQSAITASDKEDVIYVRPKDWTSLPYSYPGLNTAYAESCSIPYAKQGLSIIGIANQSARGIPHGVVLRETASAITANMKVYAPLCAFENLVFERGGTETGGQLVFQGGTAATYEANAATVYNCYFFYGVGTAGPGGWGGGVMSDQIWGLTVDSCYFMNCRAGIAFQSGGATSGSFVARNNWFASRDTTASGISVDILVYTQGAANILIADSYFAHLIPSLSGGIGKWINITGDVRQGLIANCYLGGVMGTTYTCGVAGTAISNPANVGVANVYCDNALLATNA